MRFLGNRSLVLSLVFAMLGGTATLLVLADRDASSGGESVSVVVAARTIPVGMRLTADDLTVKEVASGSTHADALRDLDATIGQYATLPMVDGEMLLATKVSKDQPGSQLAIVIPEGRVAVSVAVNDVISTGFVAPGDTVDVLGVVTKDAADSAALVLSDITVLAVSSQIIGAEPQGNSNAPNASKPNNPQSLDATVTLAVTLEEARKLVQIDEVGTLRLALRQRASTDTSAVQR